LTSEAVVALVTLPDDSGTVFAGTAGGGVFVSTNHGANWTASNAGLSDLYVRALAAGGDNIYAATDGGKRVYVSTNKGANWTAALGTDLWHEIVWSLLVAPGPSRANTSSLFAATADGRVYVSTDNGNSWLGTRVVPETTDVFALALNGTQLFAGTYGGDVYCSNDYGTSWSPVNEGLANHRVRALAIQGEFLYAGTSGGGVWRRRLSEMVTSINVSPSSLPTAFHLEQNYPNPFNSRTSIRYSVPYATYVSVEVFNLLGSRVATLVSQQMERGNYLAEWNAEGMATGVYVCRLLGGGTAVTRKVLLIR
jgi:hypothetical protein